ncbi:DUF2723 domain-containing protein [archaeon]|nr:MAG: DUF2723 domain-containing protein [archaeon]
MKDKLAILTSVAAVIFAVYVYTLSPSIAGGDSGEIVAEGCQLGTAHPPGYPLITILIHLISKMQVFRSVAYRVNLFCAFCTSLAALFMGLMVPSIFGGVLTMTTFSFSPLIWQYAVTAEVFPLNTLFAALILYITYTFAKAPSLYKAHLGAFVCGLALCNQHTIVLFEVPLILYMIFLLRREWLQNIRIAFSLAASLFAGLAPYLYLPLSANFNPTPGSWGHLQSLQGFLHHFLRKDYGTFQLFSGAAGKNAEGFGVRQVAYMKDLVNVQGSVYVTVLACLGMLAILFVARVESTAQVLSSKGTVSRAVQIGGRQTTSKPRSKDGKKAIPTPISTEPVSPSPTSLQVDKTECSYVYVVFVCTHLFYLCVFHSLANLPLGDKLLYGVHQRFWMQPNVVYFMYVGFGLEYVWKIVEKVVVGRGEGGHNKVSSTSSSSSGLANKRTLLRLLVVAAVALLSYYHFRKAYFISSQNSAIYFHQYARAVLSPLPPSSVLLVNYDQQWTSVRYAQVCEGYRSDITSLQLSMMTYKWFQHKRSLYPHLMFPGTYLTYPNSPTIQRDNAFTLYDFVLANADKQIYLGGKLSYPDEMLTTEYEVMPVGLVSKFVPMASSPSGSSYMKQVHSSWSSVTKALPALPSDIKYPEETWEWTIGRDYKDRVGDTASYYLDVAIKTAGRDAKALVDAVYWLETSLYLEGGLANSPSGLLKNAGLGHVHLVQNKALKESEPLPLPLDVHNSTEHIQWPTGT